MIALIVLGFCLIFLAWLVPGFGLLLLFWWPLLVPTLAVIWLFFMGFGAFLCAGRERKAHPWESWGIDDEPKK